MSTLKQRFLLVSDMHYTMDQPTKEWKLAHPEVKPSAAAVHAFGKTQREKIEKIYEDILTEHQQSPLDAVLVLGDLSIDDYDYRKLPINYCKRFKEELMDRLPCPSYAIPGNHDSWPNALWKEFMGRDRRFSVEIGDVAFIMEDSFANVPALPNDPASGAGFTPMDADFLRSCLQKHKGKHLFLCAHHIHAAGNSFSEECRQLLRECEDLIWLFRGHTHIAAVYKGREGAGGKPLIDIGGYGYEGVMVEARLDFNVFDEKWAWGYQILEIYDDKIRTYHVRTDNVYHATNGEFSVSKRRERVLEHPIL